MMPHGTRPPGEWNEACVNMKKFTSPKALKAVKNFTYVYGVWGSFMNHLYLFVM